MKLHAELTYNKLNFNESEFSDIDNLIKKSEENYDLLISLSRKASSIYKVLGGYFVTQTVALSQKNPDIFMPELYNGKPQLGRGF